MKRICAVLLCVAIITAAMWNPPTVLARSESIAVCKMPAVVYTYADEKSTPLCALSEGEVFDVADTKTVDGTLWYGVEYRGAAGWLAASDVTVLAKGESYAKPKSYLARSLVVSLPFVLRTGPGMQYPSAGTVYAGEKYTSLGTGNDSGGITWFAVEHNGRTAWIKRNAVKITNSYTSIPARDFSAEGTPVIYLSPSNQVNNSYSAGGTNECVQTTRVAEALRKYLEETYVCQVYVGAQSTPISRYGRPMEAYRKDADVYVALHTNANSASKCYGAQGYYFPGCVQSQLLASNLCLAMKEISPYKPNVAALKDGMVYLDNIGYGEARESGSLGMISLLFEFEFHDHSDTALWVINNTKTIAEAIGDGIAKTIGMRHIGICDYAQGK